MSKTYSFENSRFDTFPGFRDDYIENIDAMPLGEELKLDYIWVAETTEGDIVQFKPSGEEVLYSEVRDAASRGEVEAIYWVPVDPETGDTVGVTGLKGFDFLRASESASAEEARLLRRGYKRINASSPRREEVSQDRRAYIIEVEDKICFVSDEGNIEVVDDDEHDMEEYL